MNWDTIKYIFQIPLGWYKSIHDKVFNAYGTNFIKVRDGDDGAMQIDVDEATFNEAVMRVAGGGVRSVDGITPDPDGNIPLGAVRTINNEAPDANGNIDIELSGTVTSVNDIAPDLDGNVDLGSLVYTVNNQTPDAAGDVQVGTVKSVNLLAPNAAGNISIPAIYSINNKYTVAGSHNFDGVVFSINGATPDEQGEVTLSAIGAVESVDGIAPGPTGDVALHAVKSVDNIQPDNNGNVELTGVVRSVNNFIYPDADGNIELDLSSVVKSVNQIEPDADGNIELTGLVYSVNGQSPDNAGNVTIDIDGFVKKVDGLLPDNTGNVVLGAVRAVNNIMPDANGDLSISLIESVDGHYPTNGAVSFNLTSDKWLKSDSNGHIVTTDDKPIVADTTKTGYLYNTHGTISYKDEQYVDLTSDQTITGKKTFNNDVVIHNGGSLLVTDSNGGTSISRSGVTINTIVPFINFSTPGTAANDAFIVLDSNAGNKIVLMSPHGVVLNAPANQALLTNQPTDTSTSSHAIATCGYVQTQAMSLSGDQTITGQKTFKKELRIGFDGIRDVNSRAREVQGLRFRDGTPDKFIVGQVECELGSNGSNILRNYVYKNVGGTTQQAGVTYWIDNDGNKNTSQYANIHTFGGSDISRAIFSTSEQYCSLTFMPNQNLVHGGVISFRYKGAASDTSRIADFQNELQIRSYAKNLQLYTDSPNQAVLTQTPTVLFSNRTSKAIATCGWVNSIIANNLPNMSKVVYTDTAQTISGQKTFTATNTYTNNIAATGSITATGTVTTGGESTGTSRLEYGRLYLNRNTPAIYLQNGSYTSLIYMSGTEMRVQNTTGSIQLNGINVYRETTPPDTDATDAKNIPTLGWCNSKFGKVKTVNGVAPDSSGNVTITTGSVKTVDHISPDDQGNIQINAIRTINGNSADINGDFSGVVMSVNNITPTDGNVQLTGYVKTINRTEPDQFGDISNVAMTVDGHEANNNGAVSFGLANGKWVKTDGDGHLTTTDETPIAVDTSQYQPKTVTKTVVTSVTWNGTALKYKSEKWQFVNGVLVNITTNSDTTIDTPVAYSAT